MIYKFGIIIVSLALMLSGCATQAPVPKAGLTVLSTDDSKEWDIANRLLQQGEGNSCRVVEAQEQGEHILELVAGNQGHMEYFVEGEADHTTFAQMRLQFLSTQGQGMIKLSALDEQGRVIGQTGFVYTGQLPQKDLQNKWQDLRYRTNFQGNWLEQTYNFSDMLASLPQTSLAATKKYRLSVEVSQGQHALISKLAMGTDRSKAVRIIPSSLAYHATQGDLVTIEADIQNVSHQIMKNVVVRLIEPYGYGLVINSPVAQTIEQLSPGERRHSKWQVKAQRPDAVNLNKPWTMKFSINDVEALDKVQVAVVDNKPGKVFYVMTEDLEPIDGAGYPKVWGNCNGWLDPQEFVGQVVHKSEALNRIADKHGAKWTHYIAWPAVKAAQWAAQRSQTGQWPSAISAIEQSVAQEAKQGHEYGIHLHSDYDPYLPGNVLSYNEAVDGLWANHLKHGWAHSLLAEGDFSDYASRAGMLYDYQRILDKLSSRSDQGQLLTARVGSFDFGNGKADEAMSTSVYKKVGLWGSSDADGNTGDAITTGEYGREIYFAAPDDINMPATDLSQLGIVEFRPTPRESIGYDTQSAAVMNGKTDQGMAFFVTDSGNVKPGVHAVIGFTHAMFVMGQGDWQSTQGGQFQVIDDHLAYVKTRYADRGLLSFSTASQLVEAYLDYYTPKLLAIYGKCLLDEQGVSEYAIRLLGNDIVVDANHSHVVNVKYPLYFRDSAYRISVLKNGQPIYSTWGLPTPFNDIRFSVDDKQAVYTLQIYHNELAYKIMSKLHAARARIVKIFK